MVTWHSFLLGLLTILVLDMGFVVELHTLVPLLEVMVGGGEGWIVHTVVDVGVSEVKTGEMSGRQ